jgi:hypothetical protein
VIACRDEHPVVRHRDRLQPGPAARGQQAVDGGEVGGPVALTDRLDHLHAEDHGVAAVGFAVVTQLHVHPVRDASGFGAAAGRSPL